MNRSAWAALALIALPLAAVGVHCALVETSGDVVVLTTEAADGSTQRTRLWYVEHEGRPWINAGSEEAEWLARIRRNPSVTVEIRGEEAAFRAVPVPEARDAILALMATQYSSGDRWVRFMVGSESIPVRLDPPAP
jgi:hypothetical protein